MRRGRKRDGGREEREMERRARSCSHTIVLKHRHSQMMAVLPLPSSSANSMVWWYESVQ